MLHDTSPRTNIWRMHHTTGGQWGANAAARCCSPSGSFLAMDFFPAALRARQPRTSGAKQMFTTGRWEYSFKTKNSWHLHLIRLSVRLTLWGQRDRVGMFWVIKEFLMFIWRSHNTNRLLGLLGEMIIASVAWLTSLRIVVVDTYCIMFSGYVGFFVASSANSSVSDRLSLNWPEVTPLFV